MKKSTALWLVSGVAKPALVSTLVKPSLDRAMATVKRLAEEAAWRESSRISAIWRGSVSFGDFGLSGTSA